MSVKLVKLLSKLTCNSELFVLQPIAIRYNHITADTELYWFAPHILFCEIFPIIRDHTIPSIERSSSKPSWILKLRFICSTNGLDLYNRTPPPLFFPGYYRSGERTCVFFKYFQLIRLKNEQPFYRWRCIFCFRRWFLRSVFGNHLGYPSINSFICIHFIFYFSVILFVFFL